LWCWLPLFSPQWGNWSSCSLMGVLSCSHSREGRVSAHWDYRPPSTSRVADCHLVEELRFQLLERRDVTLLQGGTALGFCVPWVNRASVATCRVACYIFPPFSGESGILSLWQETEGSFAVRESGECWASMLCWEESPLVPAE
jgi:hypothetical protein